MVVACGCNGQFGCPAIVQEIREHCSKQGQQLCWSSFNADVTQAPLWQFLSLNTLEQPSLFGKAGKGWHFYTWYLVDTLRASFLAESRDKLCEWASCLPCHVRGSAKPTKLQRQFIGKAERGWAHQQGIKQTIIGQNRTSEILKTAFD